MFLTAICKDGEKQVYFDTDSKNYYPEAGIYFPSEESYGIKGNLILLVHAGGPEIWAEEITAQQAKNIIDKITSLLAEAMGKIA